jgi:hypothetical protein
MTAAILLSERVRQRIKSFGPQQRDDVFVSEQLPQGLRNENELVSPAFADDG